MLKLLQLLCFQIVLSASSYDDDIEEEDPDIKYNSTLKCGNKNTTVTYDCKPKICDINYPVIKNVRWNKLVCCGGCTPSQCCAPEKWWLTIPILCAYVLVIAGYIYITRPSSSFSKGWMNNTQKSARYLTAVNDEAQGKSTKISRGDSENQHLWSCLRWCPPLT